MAIQSSKRVGNLTTMYGLESIVNRLTGDIGRLEYQLSRIKDDTNSPTRAETVRVYSDMLETRRDLLEQIQLQILSSAVEQWAVV